MKKRKKQTRNFRRGTFASLFYASQDELPRSGPIRYTHSLSYEDAQSVLTPYFAKCEFLAPSINKEHKHTTVLVTPNDDSPYFTTLGDMVVIPLKGEICIEMLKPGLMETISSKEVISESTVIQATVPHRIIGSADSKALIVYGLSSPICRSLLQFPRYDDEAMKDWRFYPMFASGLTQTIGKLRREVGLDMFKLGEWLGIDRAQVSRIESGMINLSFLRIQQLSRLLEFDPQKFLKPLWYCHPVENKVFYRPISLALGEDYPSINNLGNGTLITLEGGGVLAHTKHVDSLQENTNWINPFGSLYFCQCSELKLELHDKSASVVIV